MYNRDFVSVEYAFSSLEKEGCKYKENTPLHADAFRFGKTDLIGEIIEGASNILEKRFGDMAFEEWEKQNSKPKKILMTSINELREMGKDMKNWKDTKRNDPIWILIGDLVFIIGALLDHSKGVKEDWYKG